ncbi:hypothetical protein JTB14_009356 [Gonioctena quinquepunctata]|nr:hypothetical protein JTB14_009356 [Gonioctena quinquepunctata]
MSQPQNAPLGLNGTAISPSASASHICLPKIDLGKFPGDNKAFPPFLDLYDALVHNNFSLSRSKQVRVCHVFFRFEQQQQRYPERKRTACNGYYGYIAKNCDRVPDNDNGDKRKETKSDRAFFTALSVQGSPEVDDWYLDSGCSVHLAKDEHCFVSELKPAKVSFSTADQQGSMNSNSVGDIQLPVKVDGAVMPVKVRNVYHVPQLRVNLLSVSQIVDNGNTVVFDSKGALVTDANGEVLASATLKNNLFRLDLDSSIPIFLAAPNTENDSSDATGDFSPVDSESADSSIVTMYEGASDDFLGFPDSAESEADDASSAVESDSDYIPPKTVDVENKNLRRGPRGPRKTAKSSTRL